MVPSNWLQKRYIYFYPQLQIKLTVHCQPLSCILKCRLSAHYLSMQKLINRYSKRLCHHNYNLYITVVAAGIVYTSTTEFNNLEYVAYGESACGIKMYIFYEVWDYVVLLTCKLARLLQLIYVYICWILYIILHIAYTKPSYPMCFITDSQVYSKVYI